MNSASLPKKIDSLLNGLPDAAAAARFFVELGQRFPREAAKLERDDALLSDVLTLAAFSPLLSATILHNPDYLQWLGRERKDVKVRTLEELLESLARFSMIHTGAETDVMLSRFRRRELLRIYLRDIRRLATVTEITEEISNLADAVLEYALRESIREIDNRFGQPLERSEKGRLRRAGFCIVALGKLGSRELNYSSDIDLMFLYSAEGTTSGHGSRGSVTNREYFVKLAEQVIRLVGRQTGEGAAFRIDMRLRPHGTLGALTLSLDETIRYYRDEAREWERQVLIRSRGCAGEPQLFREFFSAVEESVFRRDMEPAESLANVRRSKQLIDETSRSEKGFNVKLGRGGIREIEFIAQALQLAYGGNDRWLRFPHTLVSLARLADRGYIKERELTALYDAYDFLRRLEHRLQMEHGLQTHSLPDDPAARELAAKRMGSDGEGFEAALLGHTGAVHRVFTRIFGGEAQAASGTADETSSQAAPNETRPGVGLPAELEPLKRFAAVWPHLAHRPAAAVPQDLGRPPSLSEVRSAMLDIIEAEPGLRQQMSAIRRSWSRMIMRIAAADALGHLDIGASKELQTELAEAAVEAALAIAREEVLHRSGYPAGSLSVLGLGKLGGRGVDHGSDLDLVLTYEQTDELSGITAAELYSQAVEIFVNALSGVTRDGSLYRVDLRLRPYGKNGASSTPRDVLIEYFDSTADIWELLAYVKIRGVAGPLARQTELQLRDAIHRRALVCDRDELRTETLRVRHLLERQKAGRRGHLDIKYGPGGMLDIYFATRFLQLRDDVRDDGGDRSTLAALQRLLDAGSLASADHEAFSSGYTLLSRLDHNIRLVSGRSARIPTDPAATELIAERMGFDDAARLTEMLSLHRIEVRAAFERVLAPA